jgi:hypothetical protein
MVSHIFGSYTDSDDTKLTGVPRANADVVSKGPGCLMSEVGKNEILKKRGRFSV